MRIASVILAAAVLAQYTCRRRLVRDLAAREAAPLDENGLVDVVIEPSFEIVTRHRGHSIIGQSPLVRPQNEVAARVGGCDGFPLGDSLDVFIRREDAERFIEEVRGDDPELASHPRIEERELEAGRLN